MLAAVVTVSSFTTAFAATSSPTTGQTETTATESTETSATTETEATVKVGDILYSTYTDGVTIKNTIKVTNVDDPEATLTIACDQKSVTVNTVTPDANGTTYKITKIAANAFKSSSATKVTVGKNVKTIAKKAFANSKVKTVVFKGNVTTIKKNAFKNSSVKTIKIQGLSTKKAKALRKKLRAAGYTGTIKIVK